MDKMKKTLALILNFPKKLEFIIEKRFYEHGRFVARHPWPNIFIPLILALCLGLGFLRFEEENDVRLQFSPYNSPSHYEFEVMEEFVQNKGNLYTLWVIVIAKGTGNSILELKPLEETRKLINYLHQGLQVNYENRNYTFDEICQSYCQLNDPLNIFLASYKHQKGKENRNFKLKYPVTDIFGESLYLGDSLHGVKMDENRNIQSAKLVLLHYYSMANETTDGILRKWGNKVLEKVTNFNGKYIRTLMSSEAFVQREVRRSGMSLGPYLVLGFAAVITFTVATSFRFESHRSKPWESVAGVIGPLIAGIGSFGILLLIGLKYQPIVTITIFLIMGVGVDDVFLMLRAWHRTNPASSVTERMGKTLAESGPSITITSLTNALSFGVGILSQTPAIRTFCIYSATAIVFSYLFQLSFFSGILTLSGRREAKRIDPCCCSISSMKTMNRMSQLFSSWKESFLNSWSELLMSWPIRVGVLILLIAYWSISIWGFSKIHVEISLKKLVMKDSPLVEFSELYFKEVWAESQLLTVIVNKPGNMTDPAQLKCIQTMVRDFESASHSAKEGTTELWLESYMNYLEFYGTQTFTYTELPEFLLGQNSEHFSTQLRLHEESCKMNEPQCIEAFMFTTRFQNATNYSIRKQLLDEWRSICHNHSHLNISVYDYHSYFADQIDSIKQTTQITVVVALVCMALVCLIFIPSFVSVLCAAGCVVSINLGVVGFLTHWGVDLDPISMASILMSIGFSVDMTAHMSYHFYKGHDETTKERLIRAHDSIAWPTFQAGVTTILAGVVLFFHGSYVSTVFVKANILICSFGMAHGLFILPVGLAALPFQKKISKNSTHVATVEINVYGNGISK